MASSEWSAQDLTRTNSSTAAQTNPVIGASGAAEQTGTGAGAFQPSPAPSTASADADGPNEELGANGEGASGSGKRRKVTRSRSGCLTCRKRRKLCDMEKPMCKSCGRLQLVCEWPANIPGEASRTNGNRPRKRYESTSTPALPSLTPRSQGGVAPNLPYPPAPLIAPHNQPFKLPIFPSTTGTQPGSSMHTMDDFLNIFGTSATPALSPAVQDGRAGLLQQPVPQLTGSGPIASGVQNAGMDANFGLGMDGSNMFDGLGFDDTTLQLWAADLFNIKDPPANPWDSLSSLLAPRPDRTPAPTSTFPPADPEAPARPFGSIAHSPITARPQIQSEAPHKPLLAHYQDSLSKLVACIPEDSVNGFDAFTTLASATATSQAGKGLHLATLAWAGRHMSNMGQVKYEAMSERLGEQATGIVLGLIRDIPPAKRRGEEKGLCETEAMTLLGGLLMLVQFKVCRGDVWGFTVFHEHLKDLAVLLFGQGKDVSPFPSDSLLYSFFENLVFHDMLATFSMQDKGSIVSLETLEGLASVMTEGPNTLTGTTFRVFVIQHQMSKLIRDGRKQRLTSTWNDENLIDTVSAAGGLERMLEEEKVRYQRLVDAKQNSFAAFQYMHEGFRVAATISVRSFILGAPPCSIGVRLLVRQSLSLLETMYEQDLPGFCSAHWQLFITALCATPSATSGKEEIDDRDRVERLYDNVLADLGFKNVARSRQIVHEVWNRNQGGQVLIDWLDVIQEWEWELFVV